MTDQLRIDATAVAPSEWIGDHVLVVVEPHDEAIEQFEELLRNIDPARSNIRVVVSSPRPRRRLLFSRRSENTAPSDEQQMLARCVRHAQLSGFRESGWLAVHRHRQLGEELRHHPRFDRAVLIIDPAGGGGELRRIVRQHKLPAATPAPTQRTITPRPEHRSAAAVRARIAHRPQRAI